MTDRPILFSAPMVRAILAEAKTMTRRVAKNIPPETSFFQPLKPGTRDAGKPVQFEAMKEWYEDGKVLDLIGCPYGKPGDRLWVRETWYADDYRLDRAPFRKKPDDFDMAAQMCYHADGEHPTEDGVPCPWKPSIHMPRWASRITLEITGVRVERLKNISEKDAMAEGISEVRFRPDDGFPLCLGYMVGPDDGKTVLQTSAAKAFSMLWESINGTGSWEANPWVWCVSFKRVSA